MASLGEVGEAIQKALDKLDESIAAHRQAADFAEDARDLLSAAGMGSTYADVEQACAEFTSVVDGIREPEGLLDGLAGIAAAIHSYAGRQGIDASPPKPIPQPSTRPPALAAPVSNKPPSAPPDRVEALRSQLPPPVERGTGQKTHGRWLPAGQQEAASVVSGHAPESAEAWALLQKTDFPEAGPPVTLTHVETKVAVTMRRDGVQRADLVLNIRPCRDRYGCDTVVPVLLPEGFTLTVHAPNFRKTYTGGVRAPWQR